MATRWLCRLFLLLLPVLPLAAQQTRADSAQVLLEAARVLQLQGKGALANELLRHLSQRWPTTSAGQLAAGLLTTPSDEPVSGLGRTGFIAYHTALGAWLGVAIPAALDADGPEPYGVGLLIGAPAGFLASRTYAKRHALTEGQAGVISYGSQFGMWQAIGWSTVLDIGSQSVCYGEGTSRYCYQESPDRRAITASIVGALAGTAGGVLASRTNISAGTAAFVSQGGYWGTWLGLAAAIMIDQHDTEHQRLTAALAGSAIGTALAVPLSATWQPSATRVRLISAGGLAGGLAGVGAALLTRTESSRGLVGLILAGNALGIGLSTAMTRDRDLLGAELPATGALLSVRDAARFGLPLPAPTVLRADRTPRDRRWTVGLRVPLLDVEF